MHHARAQVGKLVQAMEETAVIVTIVELLIFTITAALSIAVWVQAHEPEWILISLGILASFLSFLMTVLAGYGLLPMYRIPDQLLYIVQAGMVGIPCLFFASAFIVYSKRHAKSL